MRILTINILALILILILVADYSPARAENPDYASYQLKEYRLNETVNLYNLALERLSDESSDKPLKAELKWLFKFKVLLNDHKPLPEAVFSERTLDMIRSNHSYSFTYNVILVSTQDEKLLHWLMEELFVGEAFELKSGEQIQQLFPQMVGCSRYRGAYDNLESAILDHKLGRKDTRLRHSQDIVNCSDCFSSKDLPYIAGFLFLYFENPSEIEREYIDYFLFELGEVIDITEIVLELKYLGMVKQGASRDVSRRVTDPAYRMGRASILENAGSVTPVLHREGDWLYRLPARN